MISTWLMSALIVVYVGIAGVSVYEQNYPRASYWAGAAIITTSVLWMGCKT